MSKKVETDWKRIKTMSDEDIDFSDLPELDDSFFRDAKWKPPLKKSVTIRLDADVLDWFRAQGPGYQTRINHLLRRYMKVNQVD